MPALNWTNDLSVKIDSIDNQHKKLFGLINDFYDSISKQSNTELILKLVKGMREYTVLHFTNEEKYMQSLNYTGYAAHKKEHDSFVAKVNELENKLNDGTVIVSFEITSFIKDWIKNHIQKTDKQYSDFFIKNGIV